MGDSGFYTDHNVAGHLLDPPEKFRSLFSSMIVGLNTCSLTHAIRENPVICRTWIKDFWSNAKVERQGDLIVLKSKIQHKEIVISEQVIRESLLLDDAPEFPVIYPNDRVKEVLRRMSYEGEYPPMVKRLLHPYWRLLAHTLVMCVAGNKGGSDQLSRKLTSAMVALTMGWEFNYSKYIFEEMLGNLKGSKKQLFMMYPRFLQMILETKYPSLEHTVETLDIKMLTPNIFGLMKQNRKESKVVYTEKYSLEKFGKFSEVDAQEMPAVATNAIVDEEHNVQIPIEQSMNEEDVVIIDSEEVNTDELYADVDIPSIPTADVQPVVPSTEVLAALIAKLSGKSETLLSTETVSEAQTEVVDRFTDVPLKRRRRDPRPGLVVSAAANVSPDSVTQQSSDIPVSDTPLVSTAATTVTTIPVPVFSHTEAGGSSAGGSSAGVDTDERIKRMMEEQDHVIESGGLRAFVENLIDDDDDVDVVELKRKVLLLEQDQIIKTLEISRLQEENKGQSRCITELQSTVGELSAKLLDLSQRLEAKFGSDFAGAQSQAETVQSPSAGATAERELSQSATKAPRSPVRIVDKFEDIMNTPGMRSYFASGSRGRRRFTKPKHKVPVNIVMKRKGRNVADKHNLGKDRYIMKTSYGIYDKKGNRSGIDHWGYDGDKKLWFVRRKNGELEYYENWKAFQSWTVVDLRELSEAPFHAFGADTQRGYNLYNALLREAATNFKDMVTAASGVRTHKDVIDPSTGKPLKTVVWPPTQKAKVIPLPADLHDGSLSDFKYWCYDPVQSEAIIVCGNVEYRVMDTSELMRFGESDIKVLAQHQIQVAEDFEVCGKTFTAAVSQIVSSEMWAGNRTGAETQIFGPSLGLTVEDMQRIIKSTEKGKGPQK